MRYLWTEDTGAGFHFWKLVNQLFFGNELVVESALMGECWYKDCCVSEYTNNLRCGKLEIEGGDEKIRMLIQSEKVQDIIDKLVP